MKNNKKIKLKHFLKIIVLFTIIFLVLIFGQCEYSEAGLHVPGLHCGWDHFFKKAIIGAMTFDTEINDPRDSIGIIIGVPFKLGLLTSITLLMQAFYLIIKHNNSENYYPKTKKIINISFWISFTVFLLLFLISLTISYT